MIGSGHKFIFVILFKAQKSTQNLFDPSILSTIPTRKLQGDFSLSIILASNISSTASLMTFLLFKCVWYVLTLIGVGLSPVSISFNCVSMIQS